MSGRNTIIARRLSLRAGFLFSLLDLYFRVYFLLSALLADEQVSFRLSRNMDVRASPCLCARSNPVAPFLSVHADF